MMTDQSPRVILATFAGRQDRMALLTRYAHAAIARGIVDEWHVWDFARTESDRAWLAAQFPRTRMTPANHTPYFDAGVTLPGMAHFSVSATHDVHIGLRATMPGEDCFEIVLGGWHNSRSIVRVLPAHEFDLPDNERRNGRLLMFADTPKILADHQFTNFSVTLTHDSIAVLRDGVHVIGAEKIPLGPAYQLCYRTGYGCNAEWRFAHWPARGTFLFRSGPAGQPKQHRDFNADGYPAWSRFYAHYGRHFSAYRNDVFLKCDDDIVFMDLDQLAAFIEFRKFSTDYFLLSANVINNGVCAFYQQEAGQIPRDVMELELPPDGLCGSLWASAEKANRLHDFFIQNQENFRQAPSSDPIPWSERISINFVAWRGEDLVYIPEIMHDDEAYLSYHARWHSGKDNAIWPGFIVAHLSFFAQEAGLNLPALLSSYQQLADHVLPPP